MKLITKKEAAAICGLSPKTLERHAQSEDFRIATGFTKNAMSGKVFFDEEKLRRYMADAGAVPVIEAAAEPIDAEPATAIIKSKTPAPAKTTNQGPGFDAIFRAFLMPHKIFLTLKEAAALTGLPQSALKKHSELISGRRLIRRAKLEKL